jgi:RimJ/RimL family protein N-acetyltransferase
VFTIEIAHPGSAAADLIVREYMTDVASRYHGRPAIAGEVDEALRNEPYDDLSGVTGVFLLALEEGTPVACAGARFAVDVAELTKVFTLPGYRGRGAGTQLLRVVETTCRDRGIETLRLDTRSDLVEACALYEHLGFEQVEPFNAEPYSDRWYAKRLIENHAEPHPPIVTDRLLLRQWLPEDARFQRQLWEERDPRVPPHRRIAADGSPTIADLEARIRQYDGVPAPGLLVVEQRSHGEPIGYCGLVRNDGNPDNPELAFEFLRSVWNQGFATEASRAVVDRARAVGHHRLVSTVRTWNVASQRVLNKVGFSETGRVERDVVHGDILTLALEL